MKIQAVSQSSPLASHSASDLKKGGVDQLFPKNSFLPVFLLRNSSYVYISILGNRTQGLAHSNPSPRYIFSCHKWGGGGDMIQLIFSCGTVRDAVKCPVTCVAVPLYPSLKQGVIQPQMSKGLRPGALLQAKPTAAAVRPEGTEK